MKRRHVIGLLALLGLITFVQVRNSATTGSTYSKFPFGARAFLLLLDTMEIPSEPWLLPYDSLSETEVGTTLFVISPATSNAEDKLLSWVERGNRLVYLGSMNGVSLPLFQKLGLYGVGVKPELFSNLEFIDRDELALKCNGHDACRNVSKISITTSVFTGNLSSFEKLEDASAKPRVLYRTLGKGEVWLISGEEPILNRNIDSLDNLRFLYQLATLGDRVIFDEFHHGYTAPAEISMQSKHTAVVLLMCFLGAVLVIGALSRAVRFGPPIEELPQNPAGMVEFASVLGLLCEEHRASSVLLHYLDAWKLRMESSFGISRKLPAQQTVHELVRRGHVPSTSESELRAAVDTLSHSATVPTKHAERAVSTLEQFF